ncbi:MAG: ABC transporter permease, partial [Gemmatimonadaceae bacterium]
MDNLMQDVRYAFRTLRRSPGFVAVALICLAMGIGANTAILSVLDAALLRALPYPRSEQLVALREQTAKGNTPAVAYPNFADWRERSRSFSALSGYGVGPNAVLGAHQAVRANVAAVTSGFFSVMGAGAAVGRTFASDEQAPGGNAAVVVSDRFWRDQLNGSRKALGTQLETWGMTFTVIGVMPPGFSFPEDADLWIPAEAFGVANLGSRTAHNFRVVGRLRDGVTLDQATRELDHIAARLKAQYGSDDDAVAVSVKSLHEQLTGSMRGELALLMGAVACVLLIVCLNLASALLARDRARSRELAIRTALGADQIRITRQLLTESLLLAVAGGAAGLWLAKFGIRALLALAPAGPLGTTTVSLDGRIALFTLALSLATGLLFGLGPSLRASRVSPRRALAEGGRGNTRSAGRFRSGLVVTEVAVAVVLLTGAGLLLRSLSHLVAVDPGFDAQDIITADLYPSGSRFQSDDALRGYLDRAVGSVTDLPGVTAAGAIDGLPLSGNGSDGGFAVEGGASADGYADYRLVDGNYFQAMRIPLLRGRLFGDQDAPNGNDVTVISQSLARKYWPGDNPIGHRIRFLGMDIYAERWLTVVGVVNDVRDVNLATPGGPTAYISARQRPARARSGMTVVVRTTGKAGTLGPVLR